MRRQLAHPHFAGPQSQRELPTQKVEVEPTEELGRDGIQLHGSQKWHSRHHKLLHTQRYYSTAPLSPLLPFLHRSPPSTGPPLHWSPPPPVPSLHRFPPFTNPLPPPVPSLHRSPPSTGPLPSLVPSHHWSLPQPVPSHHWSPPSTTPLFPRCYHLPQVHVGNLSC